MDKSCKSKALKKMKEKVKPYQKFGGKEKKLNKGEEVEEKKEKEEDE